MSQVEIANILEIMPPEASRLNDKLKLINAEDKDMAKLLTTLMSGEEIPVDDRKNNQLISAYKKTVVSFISIYHGLTNVKIGCNKYKEWRKTWPNGLDNNRLNELNEIGHKVLAHLLKAFNQIVHGVVWSTTSCLSLIHI